MNVICVMNVIIIAKILLEATTATVEKATIKIILHVKVIYIV